MFNKSSEPPSFMVSNAVNKVRAYKKSYYNKTSILTILYAYSTFCGRHTGKIQIIQEWLTEFSTSYFLRGKNLTSSTYTLKTLLEF
jgi:hypothetical protein